MPEEIKSAAYTTLYGRKYNNRLVIIYKLKNNYISVHTTSSGMLLLLSSLVCREITQEREILGVSISQYHSVRQYKDHLITNSKSKTILTFPDIYWYILSRCYILDFAKWCCVLCTVKPEFIQFFFCGWTSSHHFTFLPTNKGEFHQPTFDSSMQQLLTVLNFRPVVVPLSVDDWRGRQLSSGDEYCWFFAVCLCCLQHLFPYRFLYHFVLVLTLFGWCTW